MLIRYTTAGGRLTIEADCEGVKAAFELVAELSELFAGEKCGLCECEAVRPDVREVGGNKFYKLLCRRCGATLDFGQNKDGKGLFARRWHAQTKEPMPHNGWYRWQERASA